MAFRSLRRRGAYPVRRPMMRRAMARKRRPMRKRRITSRRRTVKSRSLRTRRLRKDIVTIVVKNTKRIETDYLGGTSHQGYDYVTWPLVVDFFTTRSNNINPLMYQYIRIKSVSVTWSNLKMYWLEAPVEGQIAHVIPIHSKPSFPKLLFFNSFMDKAPGGLGGSEIGGYNQAGGISSGAGTVVSFQEYLRNQPRLHRILRPGRRITCTNKEARGRWSTPSGWVFANSAFFTQQLDVMTNPLSGAHADFAKSLMLPFFKYGMSGAGAFTIDSAELDGNPYAGNRQLVVSFMQTASIKLQCKLLRSDLVTTVIPA